MQTTTENLTRYQKLTDYSDYTEITYFLSGACNYHCDFCAFKDANKFKSTPIEKTEKFVKEMRAYLNKHPGEIFNICFMGGEPFVDFDFFMQHFNIIKQLRDEFPDTVLIGAYTNGFFAKDKELLRKVLELKIDFFCVSCSVDHFNQGNWQYIANILGADFGDSFVNFGLINPEKIYSLYKEKLLSVGVSQDKIDWMFNSVHGGNTKTCINLTDEKEVREFYKDAHEYVEKSLYKPFGVFITSDVNYTSCIGEGAFPWCTLSDDLEEAILQSRKMFMLVDQYARDDCLLTCRHFQSKGYTCKNCKHIKIDKNFNIEEKDLTELKLNDKEYTTGGVHE